MANIHIALHEVLAASQGCLKCKTYNNPEVEADYRKEAAKNALKFLEAQHGISLKTATVRQVEAMIKSCGKFLSTQQLAFLNQMRSQTKSKRDAAYEQFVAVADPKAKKPLVIPANLAYVRGFARKLANVKSLEEAAKLLNDTDRSRMRQDPEAFSGVLSDADRAVLGLPRTYGRAPTYVSGLSIDQAEALVVKQFRSRQARIDPETGRVTGPLEMWQKLRQRVDVLGNDFAEKYAQELGRKKSGRKARVFNLDKTRVVIDNIEKHKAVREAEIRPGHLKPVLVTPSRSAKQKSKIEKRKKLEKAQLRESGFVFEPDDRDLFSDDEIDKILKEEHKREQETLKAPTRPASVDVMTDPERIRFFITKQMNKVDNTYGLSTQIARWSTPEWSLVDAFRDRISPAFLAQYAPQIEAALRVNNRRTGHAYASLPRDLAVSYILTAALAGEI